jgi:pimeloyl-ACP methyl ester carboxylesterase
MLNQNHTLPISIGTLNRSRACWSLISNRNLLIFVHGFGGSPTGTWRSFLQILLRDEQFAGFDIVFYGYESMQASALASATVLFDFVDPFLRRPAYLVNQSVEIKRKTNFRYQKIYVICHSLGAPISRQMLLKAWKAATPWISAVKLICFAPATTGARIEQLARSAGNQGILPLTLLFSYLGYRWPVMDDLKIGSDFLKNLTLETEMAAASDGNPVFQSLATFFGELENVIDLKQEFLWDTPYTVIPAQDHFSICKPRKPQDAAYGYLKQLVVGQTPDNRSRRPRAIDQAPHYAP